MVADCGRLGKIKEMRKGKPAFNRDVLSSEQGQLVFRRKIEESSLGGQDLIASLPTMAMDIAVKERPKTLKPRVSKGTLQLVLRKQKIGNLKGKMYREYKDLSNEVKKRCREEKEKWWNEQCADIEAMDRRHRSKAMFATVKRMTRARSERRLNEIRDKEGNLLTDDVKIDRRWEEYMAELFWSDLDNGIDRYRQRRDIDNDIDRDVRKDNPDVLRCEVEDVIRKMKNGKSEDTDGLAAELLKYGGEKVADAVHERVNEACRSGVVLTGWKISEIVTIPKPGKSKLECVVTE